jgi:hypothetical protein
LREFQIDLENARQALDDFFAPAAARKAGI